MLMKWLKKIIDKIKYSASRDKCYDLMREEDVATKFGCPGLSGGDKMTGYMHYRCVDCPYLVINKEEQ